MRAHNPPRGAELGNLLQKIVMGIEEEGEARREIIHGQTAPERGLHISDGVAESKRHFLHGSRARFANVISADRNRVPLGRALAAESENIGHDAQRWSQREDVSPARDVLFQNIVLNRSGKPRNIHALFFRHCEIERKQDGARGIDGHGGGDAVEGNAGKERFHVFERVDGHANPPHFAARERVIRIQPDLRGKIERYGKPRLSLRKQITVTRIGFTRRPKTGVLAHGPEAAAIKRRVDAARVGVFTRITRLIVIVPIGEILRRVEALELKAGARGEFHFGFFALVRSHDWTIELRLTPSANIEPPSRQRTLFALANE